jgi:hypothetical protein
MFAFIPSRPEDVGEFWYQRRTNFNLNEYRVKCKCKHSHDSHDSNSKRCRENSEKMDEKRCRENGLGSKFTNLMLLKQDCRCSNFISDFLCASCDKHWEDHETFFETEKERIQLNLPYGTK